MKISERYPDWLRDEAQGADAENAALCVNAELRVALDAVATALKAADDLTLDQVRPLLARLVDEPFRANEIVSRLAALLETRSDRLQVETEVFAGAPPPGRNGKSPLTQANRGKASSEFFKK